MSARQVRKAWKRIEEWHRKHAPKDLKGLNPGATRTELRALEKAIQRPLPEDLRASLSVHNGQPLDNRLLFGQLRLLNCTEIAECHSGYTGMYLGRESAADELFHRFYPSDAIAHDVFNSGWVPIAQEEACGNYLALDLAPGPAGTVGQIIEFGRDILTKGVVASSWGEYLLSYADLLDILIELNPDTDALFDAAYAISGLNFLDANVLWARDGWWPIVPFDPRWRTATAVALATTIQKQCDFGAMPVLADALQEAGCDAPGVLSHCRDTTCTHALGCWVLNAVLNGPLTNQRNCHQYGH